MPSSIEHLQNAFQWTWQTSVQASVFIALILLLLGIWGPCFSNRWRTFFGFLILMRLVIPVLPESSFSFLNLIPTDHVLSAVLPINPPTANDFAGAENIVLDPQIIHSHPVAASIVQTTPATTFPSFPANPADLHFPVATANPDPLPASTTPSSSPAPHPSLMTLLSLAWLLGMVSMILSAFYRRRRLLKQTKTQTCLPDDSVPAMVLDRCRHKMGLKQKIPLIPCHRIQTAAVLGCLRPVILVSPQLQENFDQSEIRDILLHELVHIQRSDILWNWLAFATQTLHWFNPLAWIASRRFRADRELACDARVLRHLPAEEFSHYGNTLIKIAALHSDAYFDPNPALAPFNHRKSEIKTRITMIAKPNKITRLTHVILTLVLVSVCSVAFTRAQDDEKPKKRKAKIEEKQKDCADCKKADQDKPSSKNRDRRGSQPKRAERGGRGEQGEGDRRRSAPPEGRGPRDMPPEAQEFAERMRALHTEIAQLHRDGNNEAARDVENELREFVRNHADLARRIGPTARGSERGPGRRPPSPEGEMERLGDELQKAKKEGRGEDAERILRHMKEIKQHPAGRPGQSDEKAHEMERRIHHLHQAAENLEQADMKEQAHQLHEQAEHMERELNQHRDGEEGRGPGEQVEREMRELHGVIDQLKKEIEHLKAELRKR